MDEIGIRIQSLREKLIKRIGEETEVRDDRVQDIIDELIMEEGREAYISLPQKQQVRIELFNSIRGLDILQELLDDDDVTEIMVNGTGGIFVERQGRISKWEKHFFSEEKLQELVQQIVAGCNRIVNESVPIADARLKDGARVNIVLAPVALNGPIITIRRFPNRPITMAQLIEWGAVTEEAVSFLKKLVKAGYNIFISGGTGSGKTTFLNALSDYIPKDERIITIEDNAELQIQGVENLVKMEARRANTEGAHEVSIRELIKSSLRMRPDRIIVGEVRGEEAIDMLQSLNTGHDGSLSTGHGNSPRDMLSRLETMVFMGMELPVSAVRRQIASGIDILVHLGRLRDKSRKVLEIAEVSGYQYETEEILLRTLYEFRESGCKEEQKVQGRLEKCGDMVNTGKFLQAGIYEW
ncbi:CpaF family protein [Hominisplanchenecus murintestinalis]|jgi:pilus assembly protein CpaF|uniref:CpaF family protein n=1 Tax=Hominisplanchenecus murintestinalis TaxID=2941517 RepID=UPI000EA108C6|nr:CpaF family protein [Hominisplanchenecus murintestinalis]NBH96784.1 CpaF family protein [Lachnospiraceae bacterium]NBI74003.1 CpaF family protein [Lachnospiraceae bacterium]RKK00960.1 CpaF family protein [Anaerotruncus sp. 1XD22-93]